MCPLVTYVNYRKLASSQTDTSTDYYYRIIDAHNALSKFLFSLQILVRCTKSYAVI